MRYVENVDHHVREHQRIRLKRLREGGDLRLQICTASATLEQVGHQIDGRERRTQIVRNRSEQARLAIARLFGLHALLIELASPSIERVDSVDECVYQACAEYERGGGKDSVDKERLLNPEYVY